MPKMEGSRFNALKDSDMNDMQRTNDVDLPEGAHNTSFSFHLAGTSLPTTHPKQRPKGPQNPKPFFKLKENVPQQYERSKPPANEYHAAPSFLSYLESESKVRKDRSKRDLQMSKDMHSSLNDAPPHNFLRSFVDPHTLTDSSNTKTRLVEVKKMKAGGKVVEPKPPDPRVPCSLMDVNSILKQSMTDIAHPNVGLHVVAMSTKNS